MTKSQLNFLGTIFFSVAAISASATAGIGGGTGEGEGVDDATYYKKDSRARLMISIPEGDPKVSDGLTSQEVLAVIRSYSQQIRHCYEQLLQRSPNARTKIIAQWTIDLEGHVKSISVKETTGPDDKMRSCIIGKAKNWNYPKPRGGKKVEVEYPFVFSPI